MMMRLHLVLLACISVGSLTPAVASSSPPAQPPAQPTTSAATPDALAPATQPASAQAPPASTPAPAAQVAAAATAPAEPAVEPDVKRLLSQGYKPQMRHGERVYCRREPVLGSRLESAWWCGTVAQLKAWTHDAQEDIEKAQRVQTHKEN
jgi:hypothetical protein